jgi:hypothetical protein
MHVSLLLVSWPAIELDHCPDGDWTERQIGAPAPPGTVVTHLKVTAG